MLTKNFRAGIISYTTEKSTKLKNFNGVENDSVSYAYCRVMNFNVSTKETGRSNFCYGNGTTKETCEDYKLENKLSNLNIDSFTVTPIIGTELESYEQANLAYRAVLTNTTSENITISEIGIYYNYSNSDDYRYLWYRKTFEPITLAPGDTYLFAIDLI